MTWNKLISKLLHLPYKFLSLHLRHRLEAAFHVCFSPIRRKLWNIHQWIACTLSWIVRWRKNSPRNFRYIHIRYILSISILLLVANKRQSWSTLPQVPFWTPATTHCHPWLIDKLWNYHNLILFNIDDTKRCSFGNMRRTALEIHKINQSICVTCSPTAQDRWRLIWPANVSFWALINIQLSKFHKKSIMCKKSYKKYENIA